MINKAVFNIDNVKNGMDIVHNAVAPTMGAAGRNALYRSPYSKKPMVTNDGVSIAKMIMLEDEEQALGADMIKQAAETTNVEAGDGTTTAVVLAHAMVEKGLEAIKNGVNPMKLKREIKEAVNLVIKKIEKDAIKVEDDAALFNIANISMEDPEVAQLITDAVKKVGESGMVIVEESSGLKIETQEMLGFSFGNGYMSPFFVNNTDKMLAEINDVHILLTDKSFSLNNDYFDLVDSLYAKGLRHLVIFCENIQGEALQTIIANKFAGKFHAVVVRKPDNASMEDMAILTGGECIMEEKLPGSLKPIQIAFLGKAKKVIISEDRTIIIGGEGKKDKIDNRVAFLKEKIENTTGFEQEKIKERVARMTGGMIIIKVGAQTEAMMKYMKLKVDDAVSSCKSAQEKGIVAGGGRCLLDSSAIALAEIKTDGADVVNHACGMPIRTIICNSGVNVDDTMLSLDLGEIWDSNKMEICKDPITSGIIDPAKVEICALKNAADMASIFLTSHVSIVDVPKTE